MDVAGHPGAVSLAAWCQRPFSVREREWREEKDRRGNKNEDPVIVPAPVDNQVDSVELLVDGSAEVLPPQNVQYTQNAMGMSMIFVSQVAFSAGNSIVSIIGDRVPSLQTTTCRFWVQGALAIVAIALRQNGHLSELKTWIGSPEKLPLFFLRGLFGCMALVCA